MGVGRLAPAGARLHRHSHPIEPFALRCVHPGRRPLMPPGSAAISLTYLASETIIPGRGLHSSTFRLNVSTCCGIRRMHDFPPVYETGGHGEV